MGFGCGWRGSALLSGMKDLSGFTATYCANGFPRAVAAALRVPTDAARSVDLLLTGNRAEPGPALSGNETEQLRLENARLAKLNARDDALSALIKQHCFPPESSSIPPKSTENVCGPSSP